MDMVCWKGEKFWVGKLLDHPEIMSQGETLEELKANLQEAFLLMGIGDITEQAIEPALDATNMNADLRNLVDRLADGTPADDISDADIQAEVDVVRRELNEPNI